MDGDHLRNNATAFAMSRKCSLNHFFLNQRPFMLLLTDTFPHHSLLHKAIFFSKLDQNSHARKNSLCSLYLTNPNPAP